MIQEILFRNFLLVLSALGLFGFRNRLLRLIYAKDLIFLETVCVVRLMLPVRSFFYKFYVQEGTEASSELKQLASSQALERQLTIPEILERQTAIDDGGVFLPVMLVWILGVFLLCVRYLRSYMLFRQTVAQESRCCLKIRKVEVRYSAAFPAPFVFGVRRSVLCLPEKWRLDADRKNLSWKLKHECMHIRRRDALRKWMCLVLCALYWYNPMVWLLKRQVFLDIELACDEAVMNGRTLDEKKSYARLLLGSIEEKKGIPVSVNFFGTNAGRRIENLFRNRKAGFRGFGMITLLCLLTAGMFCPAVAGTRETYMAEKLRCPSCGKNTLNKRVTAFLTRSEKMADCRHYAYGTDILCTRKEQVEERCLLCGHQARYQAYIEKAVYVCRGHRGKVAQEAVRDVYLNADVAEAMRKPCTKCGQILQAVPELYSPIYTGKRHACAHGSAGEDEEIRYPAVLLFTCPDCGAQKPGFTEAYQYAWVCPAG